MRRLPSFLNRRGSVMLEGAVGILTLSFLLFGSMDIASAGWKKMELQRVVELAAREAITTTDAAGPAGVAESLVRSIALAHGLPPADITVTPAPWTLNGTNTAGDYLIIQAQMPYHWFFLSGQAGGASVQLKAVSHARIE